MANPQKENGHIDIAHDIAEHLAITRIPGEAMQCLWVVWRKTYGWHKKSDKITFGQIAKLTGLKRSNVIRAMGILTDMKILTKIKSGGIEKDTRSGIEKDTIYRNEWQFNKDYDKWNLIPKKVTAGVGGIEKDTRSGIEKDTRGGIEKDTLKRNSSKENSKEIIHEKEPSYEEASFHVDHDLVHIKVNNKDKEAIKNRGKKSKARNKTTYTAEFEEFMNIYPRKEGKPLAYKYWKALIDDGFKEKDLIGAAKNYSKCCELRGQDPLYIPYSSSFLGPQKEIYNSYIGLTEEQIKKMCIAPKKEEDDDSFINPPYYKDLR